jgi:asparagine synthase (glutamine-hydrolysing)
MVRLVRTALAHPPCLVSFSGGRDSSVVLAVAADVARREGLPLPLPATYRFAGAPASQEDDWQEQVVRHLALPDWERIPLLDELDSVGPVAQAVLRRHGLLWPFNSHFHMPVLQRAAGGALLTGIGGDELFGSQVWSAARAVLSGRRRLRAARALAVGAALGPRPVRRWALARRHQVRWPWLRPEVDADINRRLADWDARTPISWDRGVAWWWRSRYRTVLASSMDALAVDAGTHLVHPFLEPSVVGAVARRVGARGPANRSAAMQALFADVLPDAVLTRRSKAQFNQAFFGEHSRAFVGAWTGSQVDTSLIDPDRLVREWHSDDPDPRSFLLLQSIWLDTLRSTPTGGST